MISDITFSWKMKRYISKPIMINFFRFSHDSVYFSVHILYKLTNSSPMCIRICCWWVNIVSWQGDYSHNSLCTLEQFSGLWGSHYIMSCGTWFVHWDHRCWGTSELTFGSLAARVTRISLEVTFRWEAWELWTPAQN